MMKFDDFQSTNFTIAKYLAKDNEVYYIEHPFTFKDYLKINKSSKEYQVRKNGFKWFSNGIIMQKHENVNVVISFPVAPTNFLPKGYIYGFFQKLNEKIILKRIKRILKEQHIKDYIYINAYDFHYPNIGNSLNARLKVYHCVDPVPWYYEKHGVNDEYQLVKNSNIVICTSKALFLEKKKLNPNTYFVPNGADLVLKADQIIVQHPILDNINKPIAGYIGAIEDRLDMDLIKELAKLNPDVNFVFVGKRFISLPPWLSEFKNIYILDPVSYESVPAVIYGFDACMIPFKKTATSASIFPLKLFEYLGMGKSVIATDFNPDLPEFTAGIVSYASTAVDFNVALKHAINISNDAFEIQKRKELALRNTWQHRADLFGTILNNYLGERPDSFTPSH